MPAFRWTWLLAAGLLLGVNPSTAQLSEQARVSLITLYPGDAVYALWGHSALRIHDPASGFDIAYNYGTFDFGNLIVFIARFAYGKLDYRLSRQHYPAVAHYMRRTQQRTAVEQHLQLSQQQKAALFTFLEHNALPANRTYRYDFLLDNCSTRIRDLFTEVLGIALPASSGSEHTYRELLIPYTSGRSFLRLGINLGMGLPSDRVAVDRSFLPLELMDVLAAMHTDSGALVTRTDTLNFVPQTGSRPIPWASAAALAVLMLGLAVTFSRKPRAACIFDRVLYTVLGLSGLLIAFLWLISLHTVTHPNVHVLWLWPTHAVIAFCPRGAPWLRVYHLAAAILAAGTVAAIPLLPQTVPAAALPWILLVALRSGHLALKPA